MIIRKLEETRLNTHQQHFEDLVLLGEEGLDEIDDKIERFKLKLQDKDSGLNTTTKIDGAPAVVCWHKFKGLPDNSICLKSFMTNNPKVISTLEDIESKYNDRPGMSKMLEYCLELSRYIPSGEAWQGDCLFISNTKKEREINGTDYITFQPNKIIYAFSENNPGYEDVKNAEFGIAFHTIYTGDVENKSQNFNVKAEDLNAPSKFYILSPALNITNKQEFNLDEIDNLQIKFNKEADNLKSDPAYNELINNKEFMSYWNTFENSNLADKKATTINVNTFIADLKEYINDKLEKEYNKKLLTLKTDKGKEKALLNKNDSIVRLNDLVENNKQTLTNLVNCLNTAATIKMLMWQGFKKNKTPYDTYYQSKSRGYIQADPEGIAMSDSDGNIVKLVDRSTFSSHNRDDDFISGFDHNESLEALDAFKLLEDVEDRKAAVAIFGKFNPPTKAHRKMIQAISDKAKSIGATPIVFASHKVGGDKHPLSYEDKFKYLKAAFGDLAEVKKSEANTPFQVLHELYLDGYTDVIYFSGPDRIGLKSSIPAYNGPKNDKLSASDYYKFNTIEVEILDFEGSPESEIRATKARQAVKDNDFELFKTLVPFNENVAKQLFGELKGVLTEELLKEKTELTKSKLIQYKDEVSAALKTVDPNLNIPDPDKNLDDYIINNDDNYQGLFVKQGDKKVSFSIKDVDKLSNKIISDDLEKLDIDINGTIYSLHPSHNSIFNSKQKFSATTTTYFQEGITMLLLLDKLNTDGKSLKDYLLASDYTNNSGIFNYIIPIDNKDRTLFQQNWNSFIDDWISSFESVVAGRQTFKEALDAIGKNKINSKPFNYLDATILHPSINNKYVNEAKILLSGADIFDKSDAYICYGDVSYIINQLKELRNNKQEYAKFMIDNCDKIIGVSLKATPAKNIKCAWDIPAKGEDYFKDYVEWHGKLSGKTQTLLFSTIDGVLQLFIRSNKDNAPGTLEFKLREADAQNGKAVSAVKSVAGPKDQELLLLPLRKDIRDFEACAKNWIKVLCDIQSPELDKQYKLTDKGKKLITRIFNLASGFAAVDDDNQRITAPYIKVY